MADKFSERLRHRARRIWRSIETHPFLRELHSGSLPMDRFTYFILQDYLYLLDFAQVLCQGAAKSPNIETLELFARHAMDAVNVERSFHATFGTTLGLSRKQLDATSTGSVTTAYVAHLHAVAQHGTLGEIVAAILPCYWIYGEVGRRLYRNRPRKPKIYRAWIEVYASDNYWKAVHEQLRLVNELGAAASRGERELMGAHFVLSSRYEYLFWDQAYRAENSPSP